MELPCKLFDTHTHFNFNAFKDDWKEVIQNTLEKKIWLVNVGAERKTSERAVKVSEQFSQGVFASVSLHPIHVHDSILEEEVKGEKIKFHTVSEKYDKSFYKSLAQKDKVVAIGETGLDYHHISSFPEEMEERLRKKQQDVFNQQLDLAGELNKPVILHCRSKNNFDAHQDILKTLREKKKTIPKLKGIIHCFSGNLELAKEYLELNFSIGFNGIITFADNYDEIVKEIPLDKIVIETDSPWLTPIPYRGKRNQSIYVEEVAKRIAVLKKTSLEEVSYQTTKNALEIFMIEYEDKK